MGNAAVIFLNNPPNIVASFMVKKEYWQKEKVTYIIID